jgi:hypothetical protein
MYKVKVIGTKKKALKAFVVEIIGFEPMTFPTGVGTS